MKINFKLKRGMSNFNSFYQDLYRILLKIPKKIADVRISPTPAPRPKTSAF